MEFFCDETNCFLERKSNGIKNKELLQMASKNKLSIYLIKEGISEKDDIFEKPDEVQILNTLSDNSPVYYAPSYVHEPSWVQSFFLHGDARLAQANSRVVLLKNLNIDGNEHIFALTFGYARFLFKPNVLEEQFGLKIVLNSIEQNQIRKISKASVGTNQKQSNEQLPKNSNISEFGFDINRDLMKNVSGKSEDEYFEKSMLTGGDIFSLTVSRDISNIDDFLIYCYHKYKEDSYKNRFAWIDNIKYVKNKDTIGRLNAQVISQINARNYSCVWMAVPEVVDWIDIKCFKISGDRSTTEYDDIYIDKVVASLRNELTDISQLTTKTIRAISSRDNSLSLYEWTAYNCLIAEISLDGNEYCLNNGKWYKIYSDFARDINNQYENLDLCQDTFISFNHTQYDGEDAYNEALRNTLQDSIMLHKYKIPIGGGQGNNIEPCDILWNNKMIHIKKNGGSSLLSHLFNQAYVSCQMWMDNKSRKKLKEKLEEEGLHNIVPDVFIPSNYEIIIAIINKFQDARPKIPFFSKVTICYTATAIETLGYQVKLKNIDIT